MCTEKNEQNDSVMYGPMNMQYVKLSLGSDVDDEWQTAQMLLLVEPEHKRMQNGCLSFRSIFETNPKGLETIAIVYKIRTNHGMSSCRSYCSAHSQTHL